jgi:hypothetical protein
MRTRLVGNVARMGRKRNTYTHGLVWKPEVIWVLGKFRRRWNDNFKKNIKYIGRDSSGSGQ